MADIYKAVFRCPELNEKEVWFVSSRKLATTMLNRHIRTASSKTQARYKHAEYTYEVTPIFQKDGDAGLDPSLFGSRT